MTGDWTDREPGLFEALADLRRLGRRAAVRWRVTLAIALAIAALFAARRARQEHAYQAKMLFRVVEGDLDPGTAPAPNRALKAYVNEIVFSNGRLLALMQKYHLSPVMLARDPRAAVEDLREDLGVVVWRNYFLEQRGEVDPARTARLELSYTHRDPQVAVDVVEELARLLAADQEARRVAATENALAGLEAAEEMAREELRRLDRQAAAARLALTTAPPTRAATLRLELAGLEQEKVPAAALLKSYEARRGAFALRLRLERSQLGMQFELVELVTPRRILISRPREVAFVALWALLLALPLVAMGVGAIDSHVYDGDDVRRLGLEVVGHVPPFPGDDVGALAGRLARDRVE